MLLTDPRLAFAGELIRHWSRIRGAALVPVKTDVDPNEMREALPFITIADVSQPETPMVRLAGTGLRRRYGQEITGSDWSRFIAPRHRPAMRAIIDLMLRQPCGIYYRFKVSGGGAVRWEAETVALPLCRRAAEPPTMTIGVTRDIAMHGIADPRMAAKATLEDIWAEFVDIGAGIPNQFPPAPP